MHRFAISLAALLTTTAFAHARDIDDQIASFITADGFNQVDIANLDMELANLWLDQTSISPGGAVGPLEKAMMIADQAISSTRTRTAISYGEIIAEEDGAPVPYSFVTVRHYNLGPAIRVIVAADYGEENTAGIEEFGLGDHIEWRFVFVPMMGNAAILLDASNRILGNKQASRQDCNGRRCLDVYSGFDDLAEWLAIEGTLPSWAPQYTAQSDDIATPAFAISQLAVLGFWADAEGGQYQWTGGEHPEAARGYEPYRFIDIDRNLGQEAAIDTVWRETALNDDSVAAISFRRLDVASDLYLMRASEPR